jgi:hypothetical protein
MAQSHGEATCFISPPLDNYDGMILQRARVVLKSGISMKLPLPDSFPTTFVKGVEWTS